MVINKTLGQLTSTVNLVGFNPQATASVHRYSPANLTGIEHVEVKVKVRPASRAGHPATA